MNYDRDKDWQAACERQWVRLAEVKQQNTLVKGGQGHSAGDVSFAAIVIIAAITVSTLAVIVWRLW